MSNSFLMLAPFTSVPSGTAAFLEVTFVCMHTCGATGKQSRSICVELAIWPHTTCMIQTVCVKHAQAPFDRSEAAAITVQARKATHVWLLMSARAPGRWKLQSTTDFAGRTLLSWLLQVASFSFCCCCSVHFWSLCNLSETLVHQVDSQLQHADIRGFLSRQQVEGLAAAFCNMQASSGHCPVKALTPCLTHNGTCFADHSIFPPHCFLSFELCTFQLCTYQLCTQQQWSLLLTASMISQYMAAVSIYHSIECTVHGFV